MIKRRHTILFLLIVVSFSSYAQNPNPGIEVARMQFQAKQVIPPAPEAAELGKYGNVPVSLYTGTPNVSIPLFELKGNSLSLPISLSYNASGFKPEDAATWVGSGWSLNAGGVITRSAMGNPDNDNNYFGVANILNPPISNNIFDYYTYMLNIQSGTREAQPDIYYYNFGGHSGKFLLKPDYSVFAKDKDLKIITPCISTNCATSKFTILDEQGITYVFEATETTNMIPFDDAGQQNPYTYTYVSAWYLTQMYSADGNDLIEFEYYATTNFQDVYSNLLHNKSVSYTYGDQDGSPCCGINHVNQDNSSIIIPPTVGIKRKFLKKITLKKSSTAIAYIDILSATGQREDESPASDESRRANQIKIFSISNGTDKLIKQYNLNYSYFGNTAATGSQAYLEKRLRLDNVQEISTDGNTVSPPAYVFTYNNNWNIPKRFTAELDHWGFYNASGNSSLVPNYYYAGSPDGQHPAHNIGEGANRQASLEGSSSTILTKIQYPTGGYTTFEYELNYAKFTNDLLYGPVGGLRIKEMIDYSFQNKQAIAKRYSYTLDDGITTSGRAGLFPEYKKITSYHHFVGLPCCSPLSGCTCEVSVWPQVDYTLTTISLSTNSVFGLGSFQGSHVGYSQVSESQVDLATGQSLGKTVYKYSNGIYNEYDDDIKAGNLEKQSVYRNDGKLLQETENSYDYPGIEIITGHIVKGEDLQTNKPNYCRYGTTNDYYNYNDNENPPSGCTNVHIYQTKLYLSTYTIQRQYKQLTQQTIKIYDQLSNSYLTTTKNFTYGNSDHNYPTLIDETTTNGDKIKTSIKYVKDYSGTANGSMASNIRQMQILNMMGLPVEKLQYRQDANGSNTKYISGQLTDYVYGQPVQLFFLEAQPPLSSVTPSSITSGSSMTFDSHYRLAATMNYDNFVNLKQQSKTNDAPVSYIWDYNQSYPIASVTGAASNQVCYTSFESNGKGGFTFSGTPVTGTAITGKRYYDISNSISAVTDPAKTYTVSYWRYSNTSPLSVTGSSSYKTGVTKNNWTLFEHIVTGTSTVTISGSGNIDEVRLYPAIAQMTTQTFEPLVGITSQCTANSQLLYYEYDGLNRLLNIKDDDGNIVKNFKYNYGLGTAPVKSTQTLWYNAPTQGSYTKQGCTGGSVGQPVIYKVPYGKHVSSTSQGDADAKASSDLQTNGQSYANANGLCLFYNTPQSDWFQKTNCLPDNGPPLLTQYTITAGTFSSTTSVAHANQLAQAALPALGLAYVNAGNFCFCQPTEGIKYINGQCVQGEKKYMGNGTVVNGMYHCPYNYYFPQDGSYSSQSYIEIRSTPCPANN